MKIRRLTAIIVPAIISALLLNACKPLKEFGNMPAYQGANEYSYQLPFYDSSKKTVVIIANNDGTELFDMIAPYYLFNATEKANVYIVAKNKFPIVVKKGFYVLPQYTFSDIDKGNIKPDVLVIPYLSASDSLHQDPVIINWIKEHFTSDAIVLSICDGAATAAATGIFDGKPLTAHASDIEGIKANFRKPLWISNANVVNSENLYSTAGVSNAAAGSLMVINKLFGAETMNKVKDNVYYSNQSLDSKYCSNTFTFGNKLSIGKKIIFRRNKKIGVLLYDNINEFELASVMDTYNRTFPKSIESFSENNQAVKTKYGLTIIPIGKIENMKLDELHVINPDLVSALGEATYTGKIVKYNNPQKEYLIDVCLKRIRVEYGRKFENVVKLMLDYN